MLPCIFVFACFRISPCVHEIWGKETGNVLTDRRAISYKRINDELLVYSDDYDDITDAQRSQEGTPTSYTIIEILLTARFATMAVRFALEVYGKEKGGNNPVG